MINTLNSVSNNAPRPHEGASALVRWLIMCLLFILSALFEYSGILWCWGQKRAMVEKEVLRSVVEKHIDNSDDIDTRITKIHSQLDNAFRSKASKIDRFSLIAFPIAFTTMSILFWTVLYKV